MATSAFLITNYRVDASGQGAGGTVFGVADPQGNIIQGFFGAVNVPQCNVAIPYWDGGATGANQTVFAATAAGQFCIYWSWNLQNGQYVFSVTAKNLVSGATDPLWTSAPSPTSSMQQNFKLDIAPNGYITLSND